MSSLLDIQQSMSPTHINFSAGSFGAYPSRSPQFLRMSALWGLGRVRSPQLLMRMSAFLASGVPSVGGSAAELWAFAAQYAVYYLI